MLSVCMCLITGCSSRRNQQSCFLRKPLVVISLLVIITMCLTVAEAAPRTEHRRRHHRRQADLAIRPKDGPNKDYKTATDTIFRRIKNNIRFYRDDLKYYLGFREVRGAKGNPKWLPKINFVAIHFHSFSNLRSRFLYLMPRLYKHAQEYRLLFEALLNVNISHSDDLFNQINKRREFLKSTINRIDLLLTDMNDTMLAVNQTIPHFNQESISNLAKLNKNVSSSEQRLNDIIAFRAYGNLQNTWKLELKCWKKRPGRKLKVCVNYEEQMARRRLNMKMPVKRRVNSFRNPNDD
ncbi:hypothetical protein JYU34_017192 [Plutella xylostella]|uniref:Uncharacterized protein n=2 Tax=Plutella xylostella TaxID=51655 RepID=A0ABQ7Q0M1_PLUXY|nr:hypothetical protein JYU34_017192 [Plutella xylostella]CAG9133604.1 unnamed protein product [Plutella xylostella]